MKKILIILIIFALFLSGCGIYNLSFFTIPDDAEFLALIQELDTPRKICQYMLDNFELEEHPYIALTPYQLYITRKGDCNDFGTFAQFMANFHSYETYLILMLLPPTPTYPTKTFHSIIVYKENDYYTYSDLQLYNPFGQCYTCFNDVMQMYDVWLSYTVYDYNMNIVEKVLNS